MSDPIKPGLAADVFLAVLAPLGGVKDEAGQWSLIVRLERSKLREALSTLRDHADLRMDQLLDVVGIDYLSYPDWRGPRYAVSYPLKSTVFSHRLTLKVLLEEDDAAVPSVHDLYRSANWAERECWDQFGIIFSGHPNPKRLLNHHEFIGHPLRKDYPCQKRQKLSVNDAMVDQLADKLISLGYEVLEMPVASTGLSLTRKEAQP